MKRVLKDWCITKELALDKRGWKLMCQNLDLWFFFFLFPFCQVFPTPFHFFDLVFYCLFSFFELVSYRPLFPPFFFALVLSLYFLARVVSSLPYPTCLGLKGLFVGCW
jgi:hypothetical protein